MISNRSFFNTAIYKNNLKRFKWGSFLYAIFLFFAVPFPLLIEDFRRLLTRFADTAERCSVILREGYMVVPVLLALAIPTVAAALIFNNVHSPRQSVFVHGLPVTRLENYISDVLSGITLMALPVIANGAVLLIMSFFKYGAIMSSSSVVYWVFLNLAILFIMFSASSATAFLTGSVAAHIGINVLVHLLPVIAALAVSVISAEFLYGFPSGTNFVANEILGNTPFIWLFTNSLNIYVNSVNLFSNMNIWLYILGSVAVYILGYLLYRVRKIEYAGDVVAFRAFKPILKYVVLAAAAIIMFTILSEADIPLFFMYAEITVLSGVVYFAIEMIINKSFRVFGNYKGFPVFLLCGALILAFFAGTSVFGFETRIPDISKIESAAVYRSRYISDPPLTEDGEIIEATRDIHASLCENIPGRSPVYSVDVDMLHITYRLKDGKTLQRSYTVPLEVIESSMEKMYTNVEYKLKVKDFYNINIENADSLELTMNSSHFWCETKLEDDDAVGLLRAVKKDVRELTYKELEGGTPLNFRISMQYTNKENEKLGVFKTDGAILTPEYDHIYRSFEIYINGNFKNTMAFLKENGAYEYFTERAENSVWLYKKPFTEPEKTEDYEIKEVSFKEMLFKEMLLKREDCVKLNPDDARHVIAEMLSGDETEKSPGEKYFVFLCSDNNFNELYMPGDRVEFSAEDLPGYIKKYL